MKLNRILPVAGVLTLLAGAALAQNIPAGAGAGVYRPPPGARVGHAVNPRHKQAVSKSCSQHNCKRSGGR